MGTRLSNPPVFYTLTQFKFNPITKISEFIPTLQEKLRHLGFADFRPETTTAINILHSDQNPTEVQNIKIERWGFNNTVGDEGYLLSQDSLVFHTTKYKTFEDFSKKATEGLRLVHELVKLTFIERIGLRYLNAISPEGEHQLADFLSPSLLGLSSKLNGTLIITFNETQMQINDGTLVARTIINANGLAVPPDLFPLQLSLLPKFTGMTGGIATLDLDFFKANRFDFDLEFASNLLSEAHDIISGSFTASTTESAINAWS